MHKKIRLVSSQFECHTSFAYYDILSHFSLFCWRNVQNVTPPLPHPAKNNSLKKFDILGPKANGLRGPPHKRNTNFGHKLKIDLRKETNLNKAQQDLFQP